MPKTMTGIEIKDVKAIMTRLLEPRAYSAVGGRDYLTDISPADLRETLTECFGLIGYGWFLMVTEKEISQTGNEKKPWAGSITMELAYRYTEDDDSEPKLSFPIVGFGGHSSSHREDVLKGSKTSALGDCAKELLWQLDVFKGKVTHKNKNAPKKSEGSSGNGSAKPEAEGPRQELKIDVLQEMMQRKAKSDAYVNYEATEKFRGFVRGTMNGLFPILSGDELADKVHTVVSFFYGKTSTTEISGGEIKALRDWMDPDADGKISDACIAEASKIAPDGMG